MVKSLMRSFFSFIGNNPVVDSFPITACPIVTVQSHEFDSGLRKEFFGSFF